MWLNQVKTGEYEYPYQVYKVPVQTSFFDHQVMSALLKFIHKGHDQHNNIDDYPREYMETMESGDGKEIVGKVG